MTQESPVNRRHLLFAGVGWATNVVLVAICLTELLIRLAPPNLGTLHDWAEKVGDVIVPMSTAIGLAVSHRRREGVEKTILIGLAALFSIAAVWLLVPHHDDDGDLNKAFFWWAVFVVWCFSHIIHHSAFNPLPTRGDVVSGALSAIIWTTLFATVWTEMVRPLVL